MAALTHVATSRIAGICLAALLGSCAGGGTTGAGSGLGASSGLDAVAPAGIDAELWQTLNRKLVRVLAEEGTARRSAAAPGGPGSSVPDLCLREQGGQSIFSWSYRQHGDYDLNGVVTVSDLTQVGLYFGKTTLDEDWQAAQLADGDNNGEVGISDVTPIGQNFGGSIDGYELQGRADANSEFQLKTDMVFTPGDKLSGIYPRFEFSSPPVPVGPDYRVVPYVDTGGGREYGTPSNLLRTTHGFDDFWHTKDGNNHRDKLAPSAGPAADPTAWEYELQGQVLFQDPIMGPVGNIYLGTFEDAEDGLNITGLGYMHCISRDGELNWRFRTGAGIAMSAAASRLGRIVFADVAGIAYCLAPDGKQLWRRQLPGLLLLSSPLIDDIGTVFICSHTLSGESLAASTLYKLLPDGSIDWSRPLNDAALASPFFNSQGEITVVDQSAELYSYDYDGVQTENFSFPDQPQNSVFLSYNYAIRGPAIAYSTNNNYIRVVLEDNSLTNFINLGEEPIHGPALTNDNDIVVATRTIAPPDPVYKLSHYTGGVKNWDMVIPGNLLTGLAVDDADVIYISTYFADDVAPPGTNGISCILPDQTVAWFYPTNSALPFAPVIADENLLLCATNDGFLTEESACSLLGISSGS